MALELGKHIGMSFGGAGNYSTQSLTPTLNNTFVNGLSGSAMLTRMVAPVGQTSSDQLTFYAFVKTVTGSPTFAIEVRRGYQVAGDDADRPEIITNAAWSTSNSTANLTNADNDTWVQFTCNVELAMGGVYWILIHNVSAAPASDYAIWVYRGVLQHLSSLTSMLYQQFTPGYTTTGFTTDPTQLGSMSPTVCKFASGDVYGSPWIASANHANNNNSRGIKFTPPVSMRVVGIHSNTSNTVTSATATIHEAATGTLVATCTPDVSIPASDSTAMRCSPVVLTGGVSYYVVINFTAASSSFIVFNMGEALANVPADVLACVPWGLVGVDGTTAQRDNGTMTEDASTVLNISVLIDDFILSGTAATETSHLFTL